MTPLAELPEWLAEKIGRARKPKSRAAEKPKPLASDAPADIQRAAKYLRTEAEPAVEGAAGDATTYLVAVQIRDMGVSEKTAFDLMAEHYNERCSPPWPLEDLEQKVRNAYTYTVNPQGIASPQAEFQDRTLAQFDHGACGSWKISQWRAAAKDLAALAERQPEGYAALRAAMAERGSITAADMDKLVAMAAGRLRSHQAEGLSGTDYADIAPPDDSGYLVEDLLFTASSSAIVADANAGKTFMVVDLGLHVASGKPWFGKEIYTPGLAILIAAEGGRAVASRIAAWRKTHDPQGSKLPFVLCTDPVVLGAGANDLAKIKAFVQAAEDRHGRLCQMLAIDTAAKAFGAGSMNDDAEMRAYVKNVRALAVEFGLLAISVQHFGKNKALGATGNRQFTNDMDTEIYLTTGKGPDAERTAFVQKQRDGRTAFAFKFRLEPVDLGADKRGKRLESCVVRPTSVAAVDEFAVREAEGPPAKALLRQDAAALKVLAGLSAEGGVARAEWRKACQAAGLFDEDMSREAVRKAHDRTAERLAAGGDVLQPEPGIFIVKKGESDG